MVGLAVKEEGELVLDGLIFSAADLDLAGLEQNLGPLHRPLPARCLQSPARDGFRCDWDHPSVLSWVVPALGRWTSSRQRTAVSTEVAKPVMPLIVTLCQLDVGAAMNLNWNVMRWSVMRSFEVWWTSFSGMQPNGLIHSRQHRHHLPYYGHCIITGTVVIKLCVCLYYIQCIVMTVLQYFAKSFCWVILQLRSNNWTQWHLTHSTSQSWASHPLCGRQLCFTPLLKHKKQN